ncbi:hypothetical protein [Rhizobium leguminosarum]|uniref:ATP dependent DNA ligase n=1 Tax=Rhizobium leguminosarum TaxID=384 RepID=UPI0032AF7A3C
MPYAPGSRSAACSPPFRSDRFYAGLNSFRQAGSQRYSDRHVKAWKLREKLDKLVAKKPAVEYVGRRKNVIWVRPRLFAEIEYRALTHDGKLRHASCKGLRDGADAAGVYEID